MTRGSAIIAAAKRSGAFAVPVLRLGLPALCAVLFAALLGAPAPAQSPAEEEQMISLKGRMLVTTKKLHDPNFREAVVFMLEHKPEGAFGLVINRPLGEMTHADLLEKLGITGEAGEGKLRIFSGGPVGQDEGYLLHSSEKLFETSKAIGEGFAVSAPEEVLAHVGRGEGPAEALLIFGYAGWSAGQLDSEMAAGAWEHVEADAEIIFDEEVASKWQRAIGLVTIDL